MDRKALYSLISIIVLLFSIVVLGCNKEEQAETKGEVKTESEGGTREAFDISVFVPGVVSGSPIYEMLVEGVQKAVDEYDHTSIKIIEGGFNQSEWIEQIQALSSSGTYELIVTSNPAMPKSVQP